MPRRLGPSGSRCRICAGRRERGAVSVALSTRETRSRVRDVRRRESLAGAAADRAAAPPHPTPQTRALRAHAAPDRCVAPGDSRSARPRRQNVVGFRVERRAGRRPFAATAARERGLRVRQRARGHAVLGGHLRSARLSGAGIRSRGRPHRARAAWRARSSSAIASALARPLHGSPSSTPPAPATRSTPGFLPPAWRADRWTRRSASAITSALSRRAELGGVDGLPRRAQLPAWARRRLEAE